MTPLFRSISCLPFLIGASFVAAPAEASIVGLGPAADYGIYTLGDYTAAGGGLQGDVAVGGNLSIGSFGLQGGIVVQGDATLGHGSISGSVQVAGTYTAPAYFPANSYSSTAGLPVDFAGLGSHLIAQSAYLASLAGTGQVNVASGNLTLVGSGAATGIEIFNLTSAQLAASTSLSIMANPGQTVIVNVSGPSASITGGMSLTGVGASHVLLNFSDAQTLTISNISVSASLLAPNAAVNFTSGNKDGTLIAGRLTSGHIGMTDTTFQGVLPSAAPPAPPATPTPEPATLAMAGTGLLLLGCRRFRRKNRAMGA